MNTKCPDAARINKVHIYTDGSCDLHDSTRPGGWAAQLNYNGNVLELAGGELNTTHNRMEMLAFFRAVERINFSSKFSYVFHTDSMYLLNVIHNRQVWEQRGLRDVANLQEVLDLWNLLDEKGFYEHDVQVLKATRHDVRHVDRLARRFRGSPVQHEERRDV